MKRAWMIVFIVALGVGVLLAQTPQQPAPTTSQEPPASTLPQSSTPAPTATPSQPTQSGSATQAAVPEQNASHIAPGSIIPARLTKTIDTKKAKQGDEVIATVPGDLKATNGQVVVPKDTKVIGHITEAQKRSKEQKESQLGIAFDQMSMQNGQPVQLPMSIQAIVAPPRNNATAASENQPPSTSSGAPSSYPSSPDRGGVMGGNTSASGTPPAAESAPNTPSNPQAQSAPNPPITENTTGMVGFKNMTLGAPDASNGTVVTSDKNNVKLEDGTLLLLRVSPSAQPNQQTPQTPQPPQQK